MYFQWMLPEMLTRKKKSQKESRGNEVQEVWGIFYRLLSMTTFDVPPLINERQLLTSPENIRATKLL